MKLLVALLTVFIFASSCCFDKAYAQTTTSVSKSCGKCGKSVSASSKVGDRCPHCGVRWGYENTSSSSTIIQSKSTDLDFGRENTNSNPAKNTTSEEYKFKEILRTETVKKKLAAFDKIKGLSSKSTSDDIFELLGEANEVKDYYDKQNNPFQFWNYKIADYTFMLIVNKRTDKLIVYSIEYDLYSFISMDELDNKVEKIKNLYSSYFNNDDIWKYGLKLKGDFQKEFGTPNLDSGGILYYNNGTTQVVFSYDEKNRRCISIEGRFNKANWVK